MEGLSVKSELVLVESVAYTLLKKQNLESVQGSELLVFDKKNFAKISAKVAVANFFVNPNFVETPDHDNVTDWIALVAI